MAVTIRQEINIINETVTQGNISNGLAQLDTAQYTNPTYYFEVIYTNTNTSGVQSAQLQDNVSGSNIVDLTVNTNVATKTRIRSTAFTPTTVGQSTVRVKAQLSSGAGGTITIYAARIIIIDNPTTFTSTETQIEIGMNKTGLTSTTSTKVVPDTTLTKYWKYTAANWDGTKTFYAEVTYLMASSKSSGTFVLQEDNGSFASWTDKVTIVNAGIASVATRVRSAAFTPTDGRNYRIAYLVASSKSAGSIFNAKIIVDQGLEQENNSFISDLVDGIQGGTAGSGQTNQAKGQSFTTGQAYSVSAVGFILTKVGSPTDNVYVELLSTSITGTVLGTSNSIAASSLPTGTTAYTKFTFSSPISVSASTKYYLRIFRDGARDTTNYIGIQSSFTSSSYSGGGKYTEDNAVWSSESATQDLVFAVYGAAPTLLEPQYLLLNTTDAGTGLQAYQTLWDSTEWSGVTNTYKHAMDSDNASNSAKLQDIDNSNTDVTGSTATGANQQVSSALTMPTTGHQIDVNVTNSTGVVAASRILVATVVTTVAAIPNKIYSYLQAINRGGTY